MGYIERTFFDVRVTHANAASNIDKPLDKLLSDNEKEKKRKYESRVINTEKGSFEPLVYSTSGSTAPQCQRHHKRIAELLSYKRNEKYSHVIAYIRTKVRFALLKSTLISIRGIRGKKRNYTTPISEVSFGLIPSEKHYESQ